MGKAGRPDNRTFPMKKRKSPRKTHELPSSLLRILNISFCRKNDAMPRARAEAIERFSSGAILGRCPKRLKWRCDMENEW